MNLNKTIFASFLGFLPFLQNSVISSELFLATGNDVVEELKVKKVNKKGNLVVKFCKKLSDYSGFVEVQNQKFLISDADVIKGKKIVWKETNLSKTKGDSISTDNLLSQGKVIVDGDCDTIGILPMIVIGAGIVAGASSSGGSGSSSSN